MENNNNKNKIFLYLLVVFFAVFVGSGIFLLMNNKKTTNNEQAISTSTVQQKNIVTPTFTPTKGFINLKNNSTLNSVKNPVDLSLMIDSDGENITALDTVISYDPISFDFVKADSIDSNFKVYSYKKDNRLTLTIVKINQNNLSSVFKGEAMVNLIFQPKVKGNFTFTILPSFDKEATKFVNSETEIIHPSLNEIKITVN